MWTFWCRRQDSFPNDDVKFLSKVRVSVQTMDGDSIRFCPCFLSCSISKSRLFPSSAMECKSGWRLFTVQFVLSSGKSTKRSWVEPMNLEFGPAIFEPSDLRAQWNERLSTVRFVLSSGKSTKRREWVRRKREGSKPNDDIRLERNIAPPVRKEWNWGVIQLSPWRSHQFDVEAKVRRLSSVSEGPPNKDKWRSLDRYRLLPCRKECLFPRSCVSAVEVVTEQLYGPTFFLALKVFRMHRAKASCLG